MSMRWIPVLLVIVTLITPQSISAQDDEEDAVELLPPDFVSAVYGFGLALPDNYISVELGGSDLWVLSIVGEIYDPSAQISIETLPDDVIDVAGFWQLIKDRDPVMERNITYEKTTSVAGTGAIQARVEKLESGKYILAITWVFVKDDDGFVLTVYPASEADLKTTRDLGSDLVDQFRWMTEDEIAAYMENPPEEAIGGGTEF